LIAECPFSVYTVAVKKCIIRTLTDDSVRPSRRSYSLACQHSAEEPTSVLSRQRLDQRIGDAKTLRNDKRAWKPQRNSASESIDWECTTVDARSPKNTGFSVTFLMRCRSPVTG
jgi:hypothetical protein